jgi:hypothetical protein
LAGSDGAKASAGGARAAGGVSFQAEVFACWAARAATGQPLQLGIAQNVRIEAVGCETGLAVDDVALALSDGGYILIQAKGGMRRVDTRALDLAKAVDQVISAYREGVRGQDPRPIDPQKDRLIIATNERASSTFAELGEVCARLRDHPKTLAVEDASKNVLQRRALKTFIDLINLRWSGAAGGPPSDAEIRGLLRVVEVTRLDLAADGVDRTRAATILEQLGGRQAFDRLVLEGLEVAREQSWRGVATLRDRLGAPPDVHAIQSDIDRLRAETDRTLTRLRDHQKIVTPDGDIAVERRIVSALAIESGGFLIVGSPGVGKSGVIAALADLDIGDKLVLAVDAVPTDRALAQVSWKLSADLAEVLRQWEGTIPATVYLDGLDAHRSGPSWLADLAVDLRGTRWRLVASIRRFELLHSRRWQDAFHGPAIRRDQSPDAELLNVRHVVVPPFDDDELAEVRRKSGSIAAVLDAGDQKLRELLSNPFNLSLAADLLIQERNEPIGVVQTQVQLLSQYWRSRVEDGVGSYGRSSAIQAVVERMTAARTLETSLEGLPAQIVDAIEDLVGRGVLEEISSSRLVRLTKSVRFRHHIVFDFAVAAAVLGSSPAGLPARLRDDPDFVIFGRPAIDFHLADLWNEDSTHSSFWQLAVDLADDHHTLAAAAAAATAIQHIEVPTDVDALLRIAPRSPAAAATFASQLANAIGAASPDRRDHVAKTIDCYDTLIGRLGHAWLPIESSVGSAQEQAIVMLIAQLNTIAPLPRPGSSAAQHAEAVVHLLESAVENPTANEWLAPHALRFIVGAAAIHSEAISLILRCIGPDLAAVWGLRYLEPVLARLGAIAAIDVHAAAALAAAPFLYDASEDRQVSLGPSQILALTQSWADAHRLLRRTVAEQSWPAFDSADPVAATETLAQILKHFNTGPTRQFRIAWGHVSGSVGGGRSLELHELDGLPDLLRTSVNGLVARTSEGEPPAEIAAWVTQIDHPEAWNSLLEVAVATPALAWHLRSVILNADGLFANLETRAAAIQLAATLSPRLSESDHHRLEKITLALPDSESDHARKPYLERARDQILVALSREHIQGDAARARLAEIDDSGHQPPPARGRHRWPVVWDQEEESLWEQLGVAPDDVTEQVEDALNLTKSAVDTDVSRDSLWAAVSTGVAAVSAAGTPGVLVDRLRHQIAAVLRKLVASHSISSDEPRGRYATRLLIALVAEQPLPSPTEGS